MSAASISSPFSSFTNTASKTLAFLFSFLHRNHSSSSSSSSSSSHLLSRFLRLAHHFPKPNPKPTPNPNLSSLHSFTAAMNSFVSARRFADAESIFNEIIAAGLSPDAATFTVLLKMYAIHLKDFDSANALIRFMHASGISPDVITYSTLVSSLCRCGRIEDAYKVLDKMIDHNCPPDCRTYTPLLRAYCAEGNIAEARLFLDWLGTVGCPPDTVCYNVLLDGLCKARDFDAVESMLREFEPDDVSYNTYIGALCKAGRVEDGFGQLEVMLAKGLRPTVVTLNILLDCLCRESDVLAVSRLLELGLEFDAVSYNIVMSRLCAVGEFSAVLKYFVDMLKKGIKPDTYGYNILIDSLCKGGKYRKAKCVYESGGFVPDNVTYNILIHGMFLAGMTSELQSLFSDMKRDNIVYDVETYNIMVDCLCKDRRFLEAIKVVREVEGVSIQEPIAHLTRWLVKRERLSDMLRLYEEMFEKGWVPNCQVYHFLIMAFCRRGSCNSKEIYKICLILERMLEVE